MASKIKVDQLETADGTGTIALQNQLSGMTSASMPTGSVLQVVSANQTSETETTSSSYIDTGLSATITPTSTSSKILVLVSQNAVIKSAGNGGVYGQLLRGSTVLAVLALNVAYTANTDQNRIGSGWTSNYLDSPSTTSATTYKTQFKAFNSISAGVSSSGAVSMITLIEIAG
tara:strand:+ start:648 stop:1166 length:519 start_codon:yes stop_codon:yes gene_type:complete